MSAVKSVKSGPLASDVREWGNANGYPSKDGQRGRLAPALILAYNAVHKGANAYKEPSKGGNAVKTFTHTAKPAKGRAVTRKVSIPQVRAALAAAGKDVGERGRIRRSDLDAYVLGTL
jgi:hypothetical protein